MADARRFRGPVDLHTHSSVSDGTETPAELVRAAAAAGLGTVALTDHDSTAGWAEAAAQGARSGITVVPGMEMSTRIEFASVHMLGYLFDPTDAALVAETERIRDGRRRRAEDMVRRISADYDITWDDVLAQATEGATVGRPHIADALVARGLASDRGDRHRHGRRRRRLLLAAGDAARADQAERDPAMTLHGVSFSSRSRSRNSWRSSSVRSTPKLPIARSTCMRSSRKSWTAFAASSEASSAADWASISAVMEEVPRA